MVTRPAVRASFGPAGYADCLPGSTRVRTCAFGQLPDRERFIEKPSPGRATQSCLMNWRCWEMTVHRCGYWITRSTGQTAARCRCLAQVPGRNRDSVGVVHRRPTARRTTAQVPGFWCLIEPGEASLAASLGWQWYALHPQPKVPATKPSSPRPSAITVCQVGPVTEARFGRASRLVLLQTAARVRARGTLTSTGVRPRRRVHPDAGRVTPTRGGRQQQPTAMDP